MGLLNGAVGVEVRATERALVGLHLTDPGEE